MRIFVYEHITGGGILDHPAEPADRVADAISRDSLLAEGRAMVQAITTDLAAIPDVLVCTTRDARLAPLHPPHCQVEVARTTAEASSQFLRLAATADWTLLIAPESGNILFHLAHRIESAGGRLLSPRTAAIEIATDKQRTADWLRQHHVPIAAGEIVTSSTPATCDEFPMVIKPLDGCGSQGIRLIRSRSELYSSLRQLDRPMRLERFIPGVPASVAVLCGPAHRLALPACRQRLSDDGRFEYLGGNTPLPVDLDVRARRLAIAAVTTQPDPLGYFGVDLVLGDDRAGSGDHVIEINPRLTTSYVGLRAVCRENLAAAMLAIAEGRPATLSFRTGPLEFDADGTIRGRVNS